MAGERAGLPLGRGVTCEIAFGSHNGWIRHVVSGFFDLHHAGVIVLTVRTGAKPCGRTLLVEATIDTRHA